MFSIYPIEVAARVGVEESVNLRCIELHLHLRSVISIILMRCVWISIQA